MDFSNESQSIELEKKLLSALMLYGGEAIPTAAQILSTDDFYRPEHKLVFKALLKLSSDGVEVDILAVERELTKTDDIRRVDRMYLYGLLNYEYTTARVKYYSEEIKKLSRLRQLAEAGRELTDEAVNERHTPAEISAFAEEKLVKIMSGEENKVVKVSDIVHDIFQEIGNREEGQTGLTTGFYDLNRITGGLKKSDLIILAARPSMGKTALALNIATAAAHKETVLICSLEMSKQQLMQRIFSALGNVNATRIQNGSLTQGEINSLGNVLDEIGNLKMFIDDTSGLSLFELKQTARRIKREHGLALIVVDYIQLMQGSKEYRGNRVQEVSELSRGLKALARELDIPVLALSQLSRAVEMRAEKKPLLSDLRESGSIEQDADIVMFLYREEYYDHTAENENLAELIIAKNRNGSTGTVRLQFEKHIVKFRDLTRIEY